MGFLVTVAREHISLLDEKVGIPQTRVAGIRLALNEVR
jgi:hypothetical protein